MKKILYSLLILLVCLNCSVYGQEKKETKDTKDEISISANNIDLDNLSLNYARNIYDNWWLRIGIIDLSVNSYEHMPFMGSFKYIDTKINGGLMLGIEKEKELTDRLSLMMGINARFTYNHLNYNTKNPAIPVNERKNTVKTYAPGIGFGLGFFYHISNNILLGAEINPTVVYYHQKSNQYNTNQLYENKGFDVSISNNNAFLTLKYRF